MKKSVIKHAKLPSAEEFIGAVNEALGAYAALAAIDGAQSDG